MLTGHQPRVHQPGRRKRMKSGLQQCLPQLRMRMLGLFLLSLFMGSAFLSTVVSAEENVGGRKLLQLGAVASGAGKLIGKAARKGDKLAAKKRAKTMLNGAAAGAAEVAIVPSALMVMASLLILIPNH